MLSLLKGVSKSFFELFFFPFRWSSLIPYQLRNLRVFFVYIYLFNCIFYIMNYLPNKFLKPRSLTSSLLGHYLFPHFYVLYEDCCSSSLPDSKFKVFLIISFSIPNSCSEIAFSVLLFYVMRSFTDLFRKAFIKRCILLLFLFYGLSGSVFMDDFITVRDKRLFWRDCL